MKITKQSSPTKVSPLTRFTILTVMALAAPSLFAQDLGQFTGKNFTGDLTPLGTVNVSQLAKAAMAPASNSGPEINPHNRLRVLRPPMQESGPFADRVPFTARTEAAAAAALSFRGFNGISHLDQRFARNGNQFSLEPPDQGLAVGNGFVLEAVNDALNIYDTNGIQQLVRPLALTEFFDLPAAIIRKTLTFGAFLTDPSALYDPETQRWFVIAFSQLNTSQGTPLPKTRLYIAVSQTSDPTGNFTIFTLNTTGAVNPDNLGPRLPDFPHFGVDHYGFYVSTNDFAVDPITAAPGNFIGATITAISKQDLITGSGGAPTVVRFQLPFLTGFEFTVFPAYVPPGTGPVLGNGGTQFFVSSNIRNTTNQGLAVWALTNTKSLDSATPALSLQAVAVDTQAYHYSPRGSTQKNGFHPLGQSLNEQLERLDFGDQRVLSVCYSGGRLWATLNSVVINQNGFERLAADYFALSPSVQGRFLTARLITQGSITESDADLLRPAIAVNAQQKGAIVFTLNGPHDYPSSAFIPINGTTPGQIQIARAGNEPDDGFTGYRAFGSNGVARWGDYSAAAVDSDGVIWLATEYVPDNARTLFANWSTYITRYKP